VTAFGYVIAEALLVRGIGPVTRLSNRPLSPSLTAFRPAPYAGSMSPSPSIVWLRNDLRLRDNPALNAALDRGEPLIIVYIHDEVSPGMRPLGRATKWWLHHSLVALKADITALGGALTLRQGAGGDIIRELVATHQAGGVFWNRRYGSARENDAILKEDLRAGGVVCHSFAGNLLFEPWTIRNGEGNPFRVFTPFWRACLATAPPRQPLVAPDSFDCLPRVPSEGVDAWDFLPTLPDWSAGLAEMWTPGESGATHRLENFVEHTLIQYHRRDEPGIESTSRLSPHLRFGEISPHIIWDAVEHGVPDGASKNKAKFLSEVGWREFSYNILFHHTDLHKTNFREEFNLFPWQQPETKMLAAWQTGVTGVPLVDAGMRELRHTGYMHNRVRMVTASFLIKNMLADWRIGEAWFWDNLVDADEANNPASWQWVAGSGADAAPYFRVFNPFLQADKFDPDRIYITKWLGDNPVNYPTEPIVDMKASRDRALAAFQELKALRLSE
jgi:deoxyribodipyrimidine photo-lyase